MTSVITKAEITERLRACLKAKGVTGYRLAVATGIPAPCVYRWLKGENTPHVKHLQVVAEYLGVPLDRLILREEERNGLQEENDAG